MPYWNCNYSSPIHIMQLTMGVASAGLAVLGEYSHKAQSPYYKHLATTLGGGISFIYTNWTWFMQYLVYTMFRYGTQHQNVQRRFAAEFIENCVIIICSGQDSVMANPAFPVFCIPVHIFTREFYTSVQCMGKSHSVPCGKGILQTRGINY